MPVCSYLVIPEPECVDTLARDLDSLSGCEVARSENRGLLLLVTDTPGPDEDRELRRRIEGMEGIQAMVLTFGEIDPDTDQADPIRSEQKKGPKSGRRGRRLPVVTPDGLPEILTNGSSPSSDSASSTPSPHPKS